MPATTDDQPILKDVTEEVDAREEAITNLCEKIKDRLSSSDTTELDSLHEVGTDILSAKDQKIYGPDVTKEVAKRIGTYRQKIQFSVRFAQVYDEAALDELRSHRTKDDEEYVWSTTHVRFLLRVKSESERAALAKECAENNWPCRKLQLAVGSTGTVAAKVKGPGADLTSSLDGLLKFMQQWSDFINMHASPKTNIHDKIAALGKSVTERHRALISQVVSLAPDFTEKVCEMNGYLSRIQLPEN